MKTPAQKDEVLVAWQSKTLTSELPVIRPESVNNDAAPLIVNPRCAYYALDEATIDQ